MGSVRHQRGRLPRRVYWVRRGIVLVVGLLLVVGIGKLFGGTGSDDGSAGLKASTSAQQKPGASVTLGPVAPTVKLHTRAKGPLLPPSGKCQDDEVSALPSVRRAWAGGPITIKVALTGTQPACTFDVSADTLVVKIESASGDRVWTSQDCQSAVRKRQVVVRSGQPVKVPVVWNGRLSDEQCTRAPDWALTGFYHVYAAAMGSTGTDVQFEVTHAPTLRVTKTPSPHPSTSTSARARAKASAEAKPSKKPTSKVSGKESKCGGDNAAGTC